MASPHGPGTFAAGGVPLLLAWLRSRFARPSAADLSAHTPKLVFFGGKGGVGKTTCACAWALDAAREGQRTLLVSTDPAHSLADVLELQVGPTATAIGPGLKVMELHPERALRDYLATVSAHLGDLVAPELRDLARKQVRMAARAPGCLDAALLDALTRLILDAGRQYDLIVFDTAPTGHTLQLLTLPEQLGEWTAGLLGQRRASKAGWLARGVSGSSDREDRVAEMLGQRAARYARIRELLCAPDQTWFIPVLVPEGPAIAETEDLLRKLRAQHLSVPFLLVNRCLPDDAEGEYATVLRQHQNARLAEIATRFAAMKRVHIQQRAEGVLGLEALRQLDLQRRCHHRELP